MGLPVHWKRHEPIDSVSSQLMPASLVTGDRHNGRKPLLAALQMGTIAGHAPVVIGFQKIEKIRHRSRPFRTVRLPLPQGGFRPRQPAIIQSGQEPVCRAPVALNKKNNICELQKKLRLPQRKINGLQSMLTKRRCDSLQERMQLSWILQKLMRLN